MKKAYIPTLIKLANALDTLGCCKEADTLDFFTKKAYDFSVANELFRDLLGTLDSVYSNFQKEGSILREDKNKLETAKKMTDRLIALLNTPAETIPYK